MNWKGCIMFENKNSLLKKKYQRKKISDILLLKVEIKKYHENWKGSLLCYLLFNLKIVYEMELRNALSLNSSMDPGIFGDFSRNNDIKNY